MLTFLTGKPGAGKSNLLVKRWIIGTRQDKDAKIANRPIYTNITGLKVEEIQRRYGGPLILPAPDDWRDTPEGSLVIYDEAQFLFPATGRPGAPDDPRLTDLAIHRKGGRDIVMATQDPTLVHHWARKFISLHVHVSRPNQMEASVVHQWNSYKSDPEDHFAIKEADESRSALDANIWELFESATVHTHKFTMPPGSRWAIRGAILVAVLIAAGLGFTVWTGNKAKASASQESRLAAGATSQQIATAAKGGDAPETAAIRPLSAAYAFRESTPTVEPINGCVASETRCRCFDFDGRMLDLDTATCRNLAEGFLPMPMDLNRFQSGDSRPRAPAPPPEARPVDFVGATASALIGGGGVGGESPMGSPPPPSVATLIGGVGGSPPTASFYPRL